MALLRLYLGICFLRQGPQDIPSSNFLFRLILLVYLVVGCAVSTLQLEWAAVFLQVAIQAVVVFVFVWGCLAMSNQGSRFLQTMMAVLGTDALISLIALPLLFWIKADPKVFPAYILLFGLMLWQLVVMGHILRCALDKPFWYGFGFAFLFVYLSYQLMAALFPVAA